VGGGRDRRTGVGKGIERMSEEKNGEEDECMEMNCEREGSRRWWVEEG
jgi:hypothetical protein